MTWKPSNIKAYNGSGSKVWSKLGKFLHCKHRYKQLWNIKWSLCRVATAILMNIIENTKLLCTKSLCGALSDYFFNVLNMLRDLSLYFSIMVEVSVTFLVFKFSNSLCCFWLFTLRFVICILYKIHIETGRKHLRLQIWSYTNLRMYCLYIPLLLELETSSSASIMHFIVFLPTIPSNDYIQNSTINYHICCSLSVEHTTRKEAGAQATAAIARNMHS